MDHESFPSINRVVLTGFLQQEPELRFTPGGVPVASFRVRIARVFNDGRGIQRESVSFVTVVAWQDLAQRVSRDAKLNQGVTVEGFLHSRSFESVRGERRTVVEVYADSVQVSPVFWVEGNEAREAKAPRSNDRRGAPRGPRREPAAERTPRAEDREAVRPEEVRQDAAGEAEPTSGGEE